MKLCLLIVVLIARIVFSVPSIDQVEDPGFIEGNFAKTLLLKDHADPNLYYYFLDRLAIVTDDDDQPEFSFAYTPTGALVSFSVFPLPQKKGLAAAKAKLLQTNPSAKFKPLPIRQGTYSLSIQVKDQETLIEAGESVIQDDTANPWSVQLALPRDTADLIVTGLSTGAVIGINYRYAFQAATTPNKVRVTLQTASLTEQFKKSNRQTDASFSRLFSQLKQSAFIKIFLAGNEPPLVSALWLVSNFLKDRCFKVLGSGVLDKGYAFDATKCANALPDEIELESADRTIITATAGLSLGGMCKSHRKLFAFAGAAGKIHLGCPDRVLPENAQMLTPQNEPKELDYMPQGNLPSNLPEEP